MKKICLKCGKEFFKKKNTSKKEWTNVKYCSKRCYTESMKGKDVFGGKRNKTPWNKGKNMPRGKDNPQYTQVTLNCLGCGKEFEVKNYRKDIAKCCSKRCISLYRNKTPESKKIRASIEFAEWRELVFERDNWTCQKCLVRSGGCKTINLNPHHIENFSEVEEKRFNIDNGITFCRNCHYNFHSNYGFRNNTREQVVAFLASSQEA